MRYHIGTAQPSKEAGKDQKQNLGRLKQHIIVWLNAALPGRCITNFTSDWNDGINLSALIDYCKPGLVPNFTTLDPNNGLHNLRNAMGLAEKHLSIPQVMQPEDLAVPKPDELSVITYLTYFCGPNSPGQMSLLLWIQKQVPNQKVNNFTTDWLSGQALGALVNALTGGDFLRYKEMGTEQSLDNCQESMDAAEQLLGVKKTINPKDFANPDLDQLVRAGYLAQFCHTEMKVALLPAAANKVEVSYLQIPEKVGPDGIVWLELDCSHAGYGVVRAEARGILTGSIHVDTKQTDLAKYQVKFQPKNVDIYTLSIFYGDDHIRGSPFTVNLHPSDPSKVSHMHTFTPQEANQDASLAFDVSKAGRGELTAECSGEFGGAIPVRIEPQPDGSFMVLFHPPQPDIYKVDVNWGTFSAQAVGSSVGPIPINVQQDIERDYTISFKPPHPDVYKVNVNWGGKPVPGSPFTINLLPPAQPDKVECAEPIYTGPGEIVELLVDISNAGAGTLTAQGGGMRYGDVEVYINKVTRTAYQVSFTPQNEDVYTLSVFFDGTPVKGSPFTIDMSPGVTPTTGIIEHEIVQRFDYISPDTNKTFTMPDISLETAGQTNEEKTPDEYTNFVGKALIVRVRPQYDEQKNAPVVAIATGERTGSTELTVTQKPDDTYEVTFDPSEPDRYTVDIKLNGQPIPRTPFIVNYIMPPSDPSKCKIIGLEDLPSVLEVNKEIPLIVDATKAGPGNLEVTADGPSSDLEPSKLAAIPTESEPGIYEVTYIPSSQGTHTLNFQWADKPIPQSPVRLAVIELATVEVHQHGKPVGVDIEYDCKPSEVRAYALHSDSNYQHKVKINKVQKGNYTLTFQPKESGLYYIHIFVRDNEIPASPIVIRYAKPPKPERCKVIGLAETTYVREPLTFTVDVSEAGDGELQVRAVGPAGKDKGTLNVGVRKEDTYTVEYIASSPGKHQFHISWAGKTIPGSPCHLSVRDRTKEQLISWLFLVDRQGASQPAELPEEGQKVELHTTTDYTLLLRVKAQTPEQKKGVLTVTATGEQYGSIPIKSTKTSKDTFEAQFSPPAPDHYTIEAKLNQEEVPNTPVEVFYSTPPPDPSKCRIIGLESIPPLLQVNKPIPFKVDTRLAGSGKLNIAADGPKAEEPPKLQATASKDVPGIVDVTYTPTVSGTHTLTLTWSGESIPGSPLNFDISPILTYAYGKGVEVDMNIECKSSELESYAIHQETAARYRVKVSKVDKGKFKLTFQPKEPGVYDLHVLVKKKEVPGSPFQLRYDIASKPESIAVRGLPDIGYVQEPITFVVDTSDAGSGELAVKVTSPATKEKKPKLIITDNKDRTYSVGYTPNAAGDHKFDILWSGKSIARSPFGVNVLQPLSEEVPIIEESATIIPEKLEESYFIPEHLLDELETEEPPKEIGLDVGEGPVKERKPEEFTIMLGRATKLKVRPEAGAQPTETLEVTVSGKNTGAANAKVSKDESGNFEVLFNPTEEDCYTLDMKLKEEPLPRGPFILNYVKPPSNPSKCKILGRENLPAVVVINEDVYLQVDSREAGYGSLDIKAEAPTLDQNTPKLEAIPSKESPRMVDVKYTPTAAGIHTLHFHWAKEEIPHSPVSFPVADPSMVVVTEPDKIELLSTAQFQVVALYAGSGHLTATCEGTKCGEVPVSVIPQEGARYDVSYIPLVPDAYDLSIKWAEREVPNSPFSVTLLPPAPLQVTEPVLQEVPKVIEPVEVAKVVEEESGFIPQDIEDTFESPSFIMETDEGVVEGEEKKPEELTNFVGTALVVKVKPQNEEQRKGQVTAIAIGERTGSTDLKVLQRPDDSYDVTFNPSEPDRYTVDIQLNEKSIPRTPFIVNYIMPPSDPSKCKIIGLEDLPSVLEVNKEIPLIVDATKAGPGDLEVTADGPPSDIEVSKLAAIAKEDEPGIFEVTYIPSSQGTHTLNFLWGGKPIPQSPVRLAVIELATVEVHQHGKPVGVDIEYDCKPSEVRAYALHSDSNYQHKVKINKVQKGKYTLTFQPKEPGLYYIHIFVRDNEIPASPIVIRYAKPPKPERCKVIGLAETTYVREPLTFTVDVSEAGFGDLQVRAVGPAGKDKGTLNVGVRKEDTYTVEYIASSPGKHQFHISWAGKTIPGSPYHLSVRDRTKEQLISWLFLVDGQGASQSVKLPEEGQKVELHTTTDNTLLLRVKAQTPEQKKGVLTVTATGEQYGSIPIKSTKTSKDTFEAQFSPPAPDHYTIEAKLNQEQVPNTPVEVFYSTPPPDPSKCRIIGLESLLPLLQVNKPIPFKVDTRLAGNGELNIAADGPKAEKHPKLQATASKDEPGIVDVTYTPTVAGTHTLTLTWSGESIPGSPLTFDISPIHTHTYGKRVEVDINIECKSSELESYAIHQKTATRYSVKISKVEKGKFKFTFQPKQPGVYGVHVLIKKKEVPGSPFYLRYDTPPKPESIAVRGLPDIGYVRDPITFVVDTSDAGSGELAVKVTSPATKEKKPELIITDNKDRTYSIGYTPNAPGEHKFDISWSGKSVPGSPFGVSVLQPLSEEVPIIEESASMIPEKLEESYFIPENLLDDLEMEEPPKEIGLDIGEGPVKERKPEEFTIMLGRATKLKVRPEAGAQPTETLEVTVSGKNTGAANAKVSKDESGNFEVLFNPTEEDCYTLDMKLKEEPLPRGPFILNYVKPPSNPSKCRILGRENLPAVVVTNEDVYLQVDSREAGYGSLDIKAEAPTLDQNTPKLEAIPSKESPRMVDVKYTPTAAGIHTLHFHWAKEEIPHSPVSFPVADPSMVVVTEPDKIELLSTAQFQVVALYAGSGHLTATCEGTKCGEVPVSVIPQEGARYDVSYIPLVPDTYDLSIKWAEREVPNSPFSVTLLPPAPLQVTEPVLQEAPKVIEPVETVDVVEEESVYTPQDFEDMFEVNLETEKQKQKEIGEEVEKEKLEEFTNFIGAALVVNVRPQNEVQKGQVTGTATGEKTGNTELKVFQRPDDSYEVTFNPSEPDRYTVDIQLNEKSIPRTPFIVNYIMPPSDSSKCKIIGLEDLPSVLEVNKEIPLIVDATKAGPGDLEVTADGPSSDLEPSKLAAIPRENESGIYEVTYIPSSQGTHTLNFLWGDKPIPQSPVRLAVIELATVEVRQHGKPVGLDIEYDCKPSEVRAYALHSDSNYQHKVKINKVQKGKYTLTFQPKEPGLYYIHIFVKDSEIPASPIVIRYAKPPKPEGCKVIGLAETTYVREPLTFTVDVSEAGDAELQVRAVGPAGKDKGTLNVGVRKEDTHTVEYIASSPGKHQFHISWAGKTIPGSPYHLSVRDRTKEQLISWLYLVDRQGARQPAELPEEGQKVEIHTTTDNSLLLRVKAQTPEQKKGPLTVTAIGEHSGTIPIKSTKTSKDTFEAQFSPPAPDHYTIEAKLNQEQVPNTPVEVFYSTSPPDPSKCRIIGLESIPPLLQVNKPISFKVDTKLAGSGKLNIAADGPKAEEPPKLQATASKDVPGIVDVTYTPTVAGTHTLTLTWSGESIPGSPLNFDISPILTYAYGKGVEVDMNIECKSSELESYGIHKDTAARYRVKVSKVDKGKFKLTFQPKEPGVYDLHVLVKKKEVPGSPFQLRYDIASKPESIAVRGLPDIGYVQEQITFVVDTSDAGSGELAVKVTSPATKEKKPKLIITDNKDRTYSIGYTPNAAGDHKFDILWSGKSIARSPFGVNVLQPLSEEVPIIEESATIIPEKLEESYFIPENLLDELETEEPPKEIGLDVGEGPVKERKSEEFTIMLGRATKLKVRPEAGAQPTETLEVTVSGKNTGAANAKVSKDESGNFEVLFNPTEEDCYTLDMKLKEEPLPRGPFILNYVKPPSNPSKCKILGRENLPAVVVTNEDIYLQVDSREAGYGSLDIKAEAPTLDQNTPKLEAIPSKESPRMVDVKYTPTAAGIHTLHFHWAKEEIPHSPVSFPVADPSMVVVTEPDKIELLSTAQFQVVALYAGSGHLTATCEGTKCGEVPVSVIPQEGARYDVSYIPLVPDTYDLSIKWAEREVPNSPFSVTLLPPAPLQVTEPVLQEAPKVIEPVETVDVVEEESVYTPQDFEDMFEVNLETEKQKQKEIGEEVEKEKLEEFTNFIGAALVVNVRPQNEVQKGQVTGTATGEKTGNTELKVFQRPDDSYEVTFNPSEPDRYTVDIQLNEKSIPRTPFIVNYIMPPSDSSKCKIIGLEDLPSVLEVNKEIPLIVDATKAGPGDLEVTADGPSSDLEPSKLAAIPRESEPGIYEVTYIPSSQGTHTLNFLWGGKPIPQSPVRLAVIELATVEVHQYGKAVGVDIEYDCKPTEVRAYALHSDSNYQHKVKINKVQKGKYTLTFQPKEPGLYYIHIFVRDNEIPASPIVIRYAKPPKPERCKVIGLAETTYVREPLTFTVDVSEAGDGELQVRAVGPAGKDKGTLNVGVRKEDTHTVEYIASSPGKHQFHISWAGKTIPGSPYHLSVRDRTKEQLISWLFLVDRQGASQPAELPEEGQKVEIHTTTDNSLLLRVKAQTPEQKKGPLTVTAIGEHSGTIPIKSTKTSKDTFEAQFSPPAPDHYTIEAKLNQEEVPNTPVEVFYSTPPPDPSKCRIIGLESIPPLLQVNQPIPFKVDTRLAGSGKLNIAADGPKAEEPPKLQATASKDVPGIVDVTYTPTVAGTHTLTLTWSGESIPGSPLNFDISPILTYAYGKGVEVDMNIECKSSELESYAIHQETAARYRVKVSKVDKGKFKLTFQPKEPGVYDLHVLVKKKEVPGSPFQLRYDIASKPESIAVRGLPDIGYVQEPITFVVDTSDAGSGELAVKVTSPATKEKKPKLIITDNKDRTYSVGYTPNAAGDHKFDILWSGKSIAGSPFGVNVLQPLSEEVPIIEESATIIPEKLEESYFIPEHLLDELETEEPPKEIGLDVGEGPVKERKPEEFTIMLGRATKLKVRPEAGAQPTETLEVTVSGKNTGAANAKVSKDESGNFEVLFNPTEEDCYTLDMKLKEEPLPRGPFILNYVKPPSNPSKCKILGRENLPAVVVTNEDVYLQVDSREAGYGSLDIKAEAPTLDQNTPKLEAIPSKESPRMVDVKYTPTAAGIHTLHFHWAKEEIPHSPVSFLVADPSMVVVTEPDKIELLSTAQFQVVALYAGSGHLTATCEGTKCGEVPVSVIPQEGARYDVSYIPLVPDTYDLSIKWAEREVPNSPFSVTLLPPAPLQVTEPVLQEVPKVIEPVEVAKVVEEESGFIPQDIEDTFESPSFIMETDEGVVEGEEKIPEELTNFVGTALVVKVKPQNEEQRKGQVTAIAIGERTGSTDLKVLQRPDDSYDVTFNPSEPDRYTVDIQLNEKSIPRTPFIVNYIMPPSDPSKCKIIGLEDLPSVLEVNKEIPLIVDATKAGPGDLEVTADGPPSDIEVSKLAAIAKEDEPGIFEVTYIPSSQGTHTLNFLWGGKPIPQSPVRLAVIELATVEVHQHGKPVGVDIEYDCKPSEVRAYALHSDSNYQHKVKINKVQKGKYTLTFQPKEPGLYYIHIFVRDNEIPASPIVIRYAKPPKPERCKVIGLAETTYVREPLTFTVDVSEAGFGDLQVRAVGPAGKDKGTLNVGVRKEDTYTVEYIANSPGKHQFHISWAGKTIPGSPYHLSVRDRTKEQLISWLFLVDGQGASQSVKLPEEGQKVELHTTTDNTLLLRVKAQTPEQKKGVLTVTATGEQYGSIPIKSTKTSKDTFEAQFSPPAPDHYTIEAKLNQEQVPNTPVEVFYSTPPPDPSKCRIIGLESLLPLLQVNKPIPFKVDTRLAGNGELNIAADGPKAEKHPKLQATASKDEPGIVDVTYTPTVAGTHTLTLTWSGESIPDSPLTFDISPIHTHTYGKRVEVDINIECKSSELESYAIHQKTATRYSVKISKVEKGKFKFTFQPKQPGVYGVHVLIKKKEVPGSPFYLRYDTPPKPESIAVRGLPDIGYVREPITFVVDTSDAGSGELAVKVTSPATKEKKPELIITDNKDRTYSIGYTPNAPGEHKFDISWSGKYVPGSPFGVNVLQPISEGVPIIEESASMIPEKLEESYFIPENLLDELETEEPPKEIGLDVGEGPVKERKPEEFTIMLGRATKLKVRPEAGAQPTETLDVTVSGKNTGAANAKVSKDESGNFEVLFNPTEEDCYTLDMKLKEEPLPRGPFILNYVKPPSNPSKCKILGRENLPAVVVTNEDVYLQVDSREAGYGSLDIKAEAPTLDQNTPKLEAIPSKESPRMVDVKYTPTAAGIHTLHFHWAKEEIPHSPVSFPVADPSMVVVTEPDKIELLSTAQFQVVASYAGSGHLTATCEGTKCGEVPVSVIPQEGARYDVSYIPLVPDTYDLSIKWAEREVPNSPFSVTLLPPAPLQVTEPVLQEAPKVIEPVETVDVVEEESVYTPQDFEDMFEVSLETEKQKEIGEVEKEKLEEFTNFIGAALVVNVRPQNEEQKKGQVTGTATGEKTGNTELKVFQRPDDSYEVTFNPSEPDRYTVDIQLNEKSIPRTPFIVNYIMPPSDPSKCKIIGLEDLPSVLEVNKEIPLIVDATKAGPGDLEVTADGPSSDLEPSKLAAIPRESEPGIYEVTYIPSSQGTHTLNFLWGGKPIPQSPVRLAVIELATVEVHQYGKAVGVDIEYDCKPSEVRAYALHSDSNYQHKVKINKVQKGKYTLTFQPKEPGLYYIHIFVKDSEIPASPIVIRYAKPPKPERCKVIGLAETTYVREPLTFTVDVSEAGDGELQVRAVGPAGKDKGTLNVGVRKEDTHTVEYIASSPGKHQFHISWAGKTIPGSPYHLSVRDRTKEQLISWLFLVDRQGARQPAELPEEGQKVEIHTTTDNNLLVRVKAQTPEQKKGALTVTATGEHSGSIPIKSTKTSKDTFEALFSPPAPDHYTIEAKLNQEQVPNTPVEVFYSTPPPDPSKCRIIGLESIPPLLQVNKPIPFKVDTRLAGSGKLNIAADGPKAEESPKLQATASKDMPGIVDVTYTPTVSGTHTLTLTWSGESIPGSPLTFDISPILTYAYGKGVEVDMNIECKSSELESYAIHQETVARYRVKVSKVDKGKFKLTFQPKEPGVYDLHVLVKKKEVPGSPFQLRYDIASKPESIAVRGLPDIGYVQEPITFVVDTSDAGSGELAVKVTSPATKEKKPKLIITDNKDRTYSIGYTPNAAGDHKFDILWSGKSIAGSPFSVNVLQPLSEEVPIIEESATIIPEKLEESYFIPENLLDELETEEPPKEIALDVGEGPVKEERKPEEFTIMLGRATKLKVRPEAGAQPTETLEVTVSGKNTGAANAKVSKDESGNFEVLFNPTEEDCYTLDMKLKEEPLPRGPFILNYVKPPSNPSKCRILGRENLPAVVVTNEDVYLQVDSREAGYGSLDIKAEAPTLDQNTPKLEAIPSKESPRMVDVKYTPTAAGIHTLHFHWAKEEIPHSPVSFPVADPNMVVVTEPHKIELLSPAQFQVVASYAGSGHLTATCEGTKCGEVPVSVIPQEGGRYDVSYLPLVPDTYDLSIKWAEREVPNSPFSVTLLPHAPLETKVKETMDVAEIVQEESGYSLDLPDSEASGSPFRFRQVTGLNLEGKTFQVGVPYKFRVDCDDIDVGVFEMCCNPPTAGSIEITPVTGTRAYQCRILPTTSGDMEIVAQYNGHHIYGSPFNFHVKPSTATNLALSITAEDVETSNATATVESTATTMQIPSILTQLIGGQYNIEFNPTQGQEYLLTFKCLLRVRSKEEEIQDTQFTLFYVEHPTNASLCCVEGDGVDAVQVGEWNTLLISTEGAGQGELTVNIEGGHGSEKPKVAITPVGENKFQIRFLLPNTGSYRIHILWGGEEIPGSPFVVECSQQFQFSISTLPTESQLGEPVQFTVVPKRTTGEGKLTVKARSSHHGTVAGKVSKERDGSYTCSIKPEEAGKYLVNIYWNKALLSGCPFKLKVVQPPNPKKVQAYGPGLQDGAVGQQGNFTIETTDAGAGTLSVNVEGPKGGFQIKLNRHPEHERVILAKYDPTNPGVYIIGITWSGDHIPGSPFTVNINE